MRKSKNQFDQGYIKDIYNWFIRPLMCYKPENTTLSEWMEDLFNLDHRQITTYKTKKRMMMPGLFCLAPHRKIQGIGFRQVQANHEVIVRKDAREPNYDVEFQGGVGNASQVFSLTESEWNSIAANLEIVKLENAQ